MAGCIADINLGQILPDINIDNTTNWIIGMLSYTGYFAKWNDWATLNKRSGYRIVKLPQNEKLHSSEHGRAIESLLKGL